jgi:iron(III) transport system permease protein
VTLLADVQGAARTRAGRRTSRPVALLIAATGVAALMAVPLVFLLIEAGGAGAGELRSLIFRSLTWSLLWNTVRLTAVVTAACAVVGTGAAWCVERTDLPGRRVWAVLVVIPLAIPDFVVSFGWNSRRTCSRGSSAGPR